MVYKLNVGTNKTIFFKKICNTTIQFQWCSQAIVRYKDIRFGKHSVKNSVTIDGIFI